MARSPILLWTLMARYGEEGIAESPLDSIKEMWTEAGLVIRVDSLMIL